MRGGQSHESVTHGTDLAFAFVSSKRSRMPDQGSRPNKSSGLFGRLLIPGREGPPSLPDAYPRPRLTHFLPLVLGVQELVAQVAEGLSEEVLVERRDRGVLVRFSEMELAVLMVDGLGAREPLVPVGKDRLSAAADATAGAGHDFHEVVRHFFAGFLGFAYLAQNIFDVA